MASFKFDLVSPERLLFAGEVEQVDVPGSEGDFGVLTGHAPMVTSFSGNAYDKARGWRDEIRDTRWICRNLAVTLHGDRY